ncbi:GNAT family N-acetyltransferase [Demequina sp.]|uniref:GNAT family N-acetyltransferase n=1 Tax=Demequina sp. TaxID=2050685 RepID=UPI003D0CC861
MPAYLRPRALERSDDLTQFECHSPAHTLWLRDHAQQAHASRSAHVMVVTERESAAVVAYYAWSMASVATGDLPARASRGVGRHRQPFALLSRLGVHGKHEGRGLGHALLADVVSRTAELGKEIGCRGLLVHAESDEARAFYLHALPEFEHSPTDPLHLALLITDIQATLRA